MYLLKVFSRKVLQILPKKTVDIGHNMIYYKIIKTLSWSGKWPVWAVCFFAEAKNRALATHDKVFRKV